MNIRPRPAFGQKQFVVSFSIITCMIASFLVMPSSIYAATGSIRPLAACSRYAINYNPAPTFTWETYTVTGCNGVSPAVEAYINNCTTNTQTVNTDTWSTQQVFAGGTRLAESGRSGYISLPNDCQWYGESLLSGPGQTFTTPLFGCSWFSWRETGQTEDYLCVRAY